jgi:hypothetical protein
MVLLCFIIASWIVSIAWRISCGRAEYGVPPEIEIEGVGAGWNAELAGAPKGEEKGAGDGLAKAPPPNADGAGLVEPKAENSDGAGAELPPKAKDVEGAGAGGEDPPKENTEGAGAAPPKPKLEGAGVGAGVEDAPPKEKTDGAGLGAVDPPPNEKVLAGAGVEDAPNEKPPGAGAGDAPKLNDMVEYVSGDGRCCGVLCGWMLSLWQWWRLVQTPWTI